MTRSGSYSALPSTAQREQTDITHYSFRASLQAVLAYLDKVDPEASKRARRRYGCFDQFGEEMQQYAWEAGEVAETFPAACECRIFRSRRKYFPSRFSVSSDIWNSSWRRIDGTAFA